MDTQTPSEQTPSEQTPSEQTPSEQTPESTPTAATSGSPTPIVDATGYTERLAGYAGRVVHRANAHMERISDRAAEEARFATDRVSARIAAARRAFDAAR